MLFEREGPGATYERLVVVQDRQVGLRAILAIHSTRRGPAFGGIRRAHYPDEAAAMADALELAEAMTHKCALMGLEAGGGKTVVMAPHAGQDPIWPKVYAALGRAIDALGGQYICGPDVGTGPALLNAVRRHTQWVNPVVNDAGASTAAGVLAGLRAVWSALDPPADAPRRVVVQGLGSVGLRVAQALIEQGVEVTGADLDDDACRRAAACGVRLVDPAGLVTIPCDVWVPCAMGHLLDDETIPQLRCRAVCGSANNQCSTADGPAKLHARGILHAPEIIVSAGAVIEGVLTVQQGTSAAVREQVRQTIGAIEGLTHEVFEQAIRSDEPPMVVARRRAVAMIEP